MKRTPISYYGIQPRKDPEGDYYMVVATHQDGTMSDASVKHRTWDAAHGAMQKLERRLEARQSHRRAAEGTPR